MHSPLSLRRVQATAIPGAAYGPQCAAQSPVRRFAAIDWRYRVSLTGTSGCLDVPSDAGAVSLFGTPERARLRS